MAGEATFRSTVIAGAAGDGNPLGHDALTWKHQAEPRPAD
jgi:hypothetical protein